jgi:hypothetical protein
LAKTEAQQHPVAGKEAIALGKSVAGLVVTVLVEQGRALGVERLGDCLVCVARRLGAGEHRSERERAREGTSQRRGESRQAFHQRRQASRPEWPAGRKSLA